MREVSYLEEFLGLHQHRAEKLWTETFGPESLVAEILDVETLEAEILGV